MPLTNGQIAVLTTLAPARDAESYVAGSTPLNRERVRYSEDIDIFHDRSDRIAASAEADAARLAAAGFALRWERRENFIQTLLIDHDGETVKVEWVADSDFRFFPALADDLFGYMLHPLDLAMNKAQAAAGRRALRDIVDLVSIHETVLPLGAVIWAAVEKSPGFTPEGLIEEIRRNQWHPTEEWARLTGIEPIEPATIHKKIRAALDEAEAFVTQMPTDWIGRLFLTADGAVEPHPARLGDYVWHQGTRGGRWPDDPQIMSALIERSRFKPA